MWEPMWLHAAQPPRRNGCHHRWIHREFCSMSLMVSSSPDAPRSANGCAGSAEAPTRAKR